MSKQEILETYGQSVYEIQLSIATEMFAQYYANQNTLGLALIDAGTTADFCLQAGAIFIERMQAQPRVTL
jgi:hypothetical protein